MSYWYQSTNNNRHPKLKEATFVQTRKGNERMEAGAVVHPIRYEYIAHGSWVLDDANWCRETYVVCHTEKYGNVIVKVSAIDFSK
jgi:hypothetical protein